jgi:hypothetical protein
MFQNQISLLNLFGDSNMGKKCENLHGTFRHKYEKLVVFLFELLSSFGEHLS